MQKINCLILAVFVTQCTANFGYSQKRNEGVRPIPLTRPEMKQMLEDVKQRQPRIPLPELTDVDRQALGERADNYETRLRYHYLSEDRSSGGSRGSGFSRTPDPAMTLDNGFKVELFWIVSRTNNCQYCLGHQESKLLGAGRSEDRIAALDGDWSEFTPSENAAFKFARKFTYEPHRLTADDIKTLKEHFSDVQIVEMLLSMSWNNSINRWKEGVGVPQNATEGGYSRLSAITAVDSNQAIDPDKFPRGTYLTPTAAKFQKAITRVAPIVIDSQGVASTAVVCDRPPLENREETQKQLSAARERTSRIPLVDEETTQKLFDVKAGTVANWQRLLAHFPVEGVRRGQALIEADHNSHLTPLLKAQISWIVARHDRAWYAVGDAQRRLIQLGQTEQQIDQLDGDWSQFPEADRVLFVVAKHLAASPVVLSDAEVGHAVETAGPAAVVQAVNYVTHRAAFNRITEAAGLPIED